MKANELMIGDWASLSETDDIVPCVVTALHPEDLFVIQPGEDAGDVLSYDTIYPIPLTAEILEKNGWEIYQEVGALFLAIKKDWNITIVAKEIGRIPYLRIAHNWICNVQYVHEFQHALRLCGLNDLADNFKV